MRTSLQLILCWLAISGTWASCTNNRNSGLPKLETVEITDITSTSAISGGRILNGGTSGITDKGLCWGTKRDPDVSGNKLSAGAGSDDFTVSMTGLQTGLEYYVRAYAENEGGVEYGDNKSFVTRQEYQKGQIIADHTVVDQYGKIPQRYIDEVKKMWLVYAGESHSAGIRTGLTLLADQDSRFAVSIKESGTPEPNSSSFLRASRGTWGDLTHSSGWIYDYGEEDWWTNPTAISRTKAGITYCNTHNLTVSAIGFGWCWDDTYGSFTKSASPVYGVRWCGVTGGGPDGEKAWGLTNDDFGITGNAVNMDTYLRATQEYIDYCTSQGYGTKVFFTTGPVDTYYDNGETGYQGYLKHEHIRKYVRADASRILFDYADILCYDANGTSNTVTWNGHSFPRITNSNGTPEQTGHISNTGAVRLAKAMWWMLARIAGWDGESE